MKYKTIIEVVCDGFDEDDASHAAGEYLKGNLESGVYMTCRTVQVSDTGGEKREGNNG